MLCLSDNSFCDCCSEAAAAFVGSGARQDQPNLLLNYLTVPLLWPT